MRTRLAVPTIPTANCHIGKENTGWAILLSLAIHRALLRMRSIGKNWRKDHERSSANLVITYAERLVCKLHKRPRARIDVASKPPNLLDLFCIILLGRPRT